jgi:nicotinic acid mononucleotide adenylyltransferase
MQAADDFEDISSTEARRLIREGRDLREILPPPVIEYFKEGYSNAGEGNA